MATDKLCAQCPESKVSQQGEGGRARKRSGYDRSSTAKRAVPNFCHLNGESGRRCKQAKVSVSCSFS